MPDEPHADAKRTTGEAIGVDERLKLIALGLWVIESLGDQSDLWFIRRDTFRTLARKETQKAGLWP